jgi:calmodulin
MQSDLETVSSQSTTHDTYLKFFSEERLAELKESFILVDQNNLGFIPAKEVGRALRSIGQNPTDEEISQLLKYACYDESSACTLSLDDFLNTVSQYNFHDERDMQDDLGEALRVFDRQDTGRLTAVQFETVLRTYCTALGDDDIGAIMALAEAAEDGTFDVRGFFEKLISK